MLPETRIRNMTYREGATSRHSTKRAERGIAPKRERSTKATASSDGGKRIACAGELCRLASLTKCGSSQGFASELRIMENSVIKSTVTSKHWNFETANLPIIGSFDFDFSSDWIWERSAENQSGCPRGFRPESG